MTKTHRTLIHAVTEYDRKQSTKRFYNIYALGMYIAAVHEIDEYLEKHGENAISLRTALVENFTGRLLDVCLKAVKQPTSTKDEQRYGIRMLFNPSTELTKG